MKLTILVAATVPTFSHHKPLVHLLSGSQRPATACQSYGSTVGQRFKWFKIIWCFNELLPSASFCILPSLHLWHPMDIVDEAITGLCYVKVNKLPRSMHYLVLHMAAWAPQSTPLHAASCICCGKTWCQLDFFELGPQLLPCPPDKTSKVVTESQIKICRQKSCTVDGVLSLEAKGSWITHKWCCRKSAGNLAKASVTRAFHDAPFSYLLVLQLQTQPERFALAVHERPKSSRLRLAMREARILKQPAQSAKTMERSA